MTVKDTALGDLLREARVKRGISVKRLARLSGVARKTIDNAEDGRNISILVLSKLLRPLGIEELVIRTDGEPAIRESERLTAAEARALAEDLDQANGILQNVARRVHAVAENGSINAVADRAESLITSFAAFVRGVDDVEELERVERSVTTLRGGGVHAVRRRPVKRQRRSG